MKLVQLFALRGPWQRQVCRDMDCLCCRGYGPIRIFIQASCSWRSEGLLWLLCGSTHSGIWRVPSPGVLLRCSAVRNSEEPPGWGSPPVDWSGTHRGTWVGSPPVDWSGTHRGTWLGSYSAVQCQAFDGPASLLFSC